MSAAAAPDMSAIPVVDIGGLRSFPQCLAPGETPRRLDPPLPAG